MNSTPGSFEHFIYNSLCPLLVIACIFVAIILSDDKKTLLVIVAVLTLVLFWYLWETYKQSHTMPEKDNSPTYLQSIHEPVELDKKEE